MENYFKHESARADIYGLDLLEERVSVIDEYLTELAAHINKSFEDFVEPEIYDEKSYQEILALYNHIYDYSYLLEYSTIEKYKQMYIRVQVNKFNRIIDEDGVTKENIYDLVLLFNDINNNFGPYVFSLSEYEKLATNINIYNDGFNEISDEFTSILFEIDKDNILELFPTLKQKYNEMHDFLDLLIVIYDGNWINLTNYYNAIACAYRVFTAISLGNSENYQENYQDLFKCIFGYYDYESSVSYLSIEEILNNNSFNNDFNMIYASLVDETVEANYNKVCEKI